MAVSGVEPGPDLPELVKGRVGVSLRARRSELSEYEGCKVHIQVGREGVQLDGIYAATIYACMGDGEGNTEVKVQLDYGHEVEAARADGLMADCAGTEDPAGVRNLVRMSRQAAMRLGAAVASTTVDV